MTIASEITRINNNIAAAYTACNNKGATMPQSQNSGNLASCIGSITTSPYLYGVSINDLFGTVNSNGVLSAPSGNINLVFTGVKDIGLSGLAYKFYQNKNVVSVSFPDLEAVGDVDALFHTFHGCSHLSSASFPKLTTISGGESCMDIFYGCNNLTSINLSNLTTITSGDALMYGFQGCSKLTSFTFTSLETISNVNIFQYAFKDCSRLANLYFPALNSNSFGNTTTQFNKMLQSVTGCSVHFPINLQSVIGSWSDVTNGFGGTNTTVLYDLARTEGAKVTFKILPSSDFATKVNYLTVEGVQYNANKFTYDEENGEGFYYLDVYVAPSTATSWTLKLLSGATIMGEINSATGYTETIDISVIN